MIYDFYVRSPVTIIIIIVFVISMKYGYFKVQIGIPKIVPIGYVDKHIYLGKLKE